MKPRYIIRTAYGRAVGDPFGAQARTFVTILDTDYCHRVVWSRSGSRERGARELIGDALRLRDEWNAEHEAWLAS